MMKMQMVSAHIVMDIRWLCIHRLNRPPSSISMSRASRSAIALSIPMLVLPVMRPDA